MTALVEFGWVRLGVLFVGPAYRKVLVAEQHATPAADDIDGDDIKDERVKIEKHILI